MVCTPLKQTNITSLRIFTLEYMFLETLYRKLLPYLFTYYFYIQATCDLIQNKLYCV
ncbi:hypothetical protein BCV72DRAFT_73058 [Rhizopus microsporus var. microsporus]|uniref:Uncharacterized protein n=1 Tax=Rhizopus microsporus var. microsporus TaxID=86635 RepID=A0A1X0RAH5_RHIZD|nr:hypothetical protein BCV72DRAFT_73058 [Rhizopus microsporus var. microsporus]